MNLSDINPKPTSKTMNKLMNSRFGFTIDYNRLSYTKAVHLSNSITENINRIRRSYGSHTTEKNSKYMELLVVRESLNRWIGENRHLLESELGKSEAILAAKDMVDSLQDMVEKVSKMQVEQLPALVDTIRDQMDPSTADQFKNTMNQLLADLTSTLGQARETADTSARQLAGEQVGGMSQEMPMPGGMPGAMPGSMPGAMPGAAPDDLDGPDEFGAQDAAAGGAGAVGREKR
jgi:hypothetical protein